MPEWSTKKVPATQHESIEVGSSLSGARAVVVYEHLHVEANVCVRIVGDRDELTLRSIDEAIEQLKALQAKMLGTS